MAGGGGGARAVHRGVVGVRYAHSASANAIAYILLVLRTRELDGLEFALAHRAAHHFKIPLRLVSTRGQNLWREAKGRHDLEPLSDQPCYKHACEGQPWYPQSMQAQQQEHALHGRRCDDHPHNHSDALPGNRHFHVEEVCVARDLGDPPLGPRSFFGGPGCPRVTEEKRAAGGELADRYNPRIFTS